MQKTPDFMPEFKANLPRQSHVLSHQFNFTATTAHLNPIFHTIVNPGETINLGFDFNLRTQPLDSAAFATVKTHTEYFFVPLSLLYQQSDQVLYGIQDQWSTALTATVASRNFPVLDFNDIISELYTSRASLVPSFVSGYVGESYGQSGIRLFDLLGYNPIGIACPDSEGTQYVNYNVFPYPILAYNCIYQYQYRLDARERFNSDSFNWDKFIPGAVVNNTGFSADYCLMHYRPLDNDYFTDVKVSPIVDVLNLAPKNSLQLAQSWLSRENDGSMPVMKSGYVGFASGTIAGSPEAVNFGPSNTISSNFGLTSNYASGASSFHNSQFNGVDLNTANIRALFANEKLWSITGRAKKNYDDQTLAHFGFKVPHDVKHEISCFGHDVSEIAIGEVISTSATSGAPLGEIAGKGYARQNAKKHKFTAPCHGVVMAIFSVVIDRNYEGGIAKHNMVVSANDLYQPEYDHLGMQPLFAYETNYFDYPSALADGDPNEIYGWQYRYEQWKRRYNRVNGAFRNQSGSLKTWCPTYTPYGNNVSSTGSVKNGNPANTESYKYFLNYPTDGNQIFLAQYPAVWSTAFETWQGWSAIYDFDPFVINGYIDAVLVSTMSDYSLPRLDA